MIIEKEKKVELVDTNDTKKNTDNSDFKQIPNESKKASKHCLMVVGIFFAIFLVFIIILFSVFTFYNHKNKNIISRNIYINQINVSGLTKDKAKSKLEEYYSNLLSNDITLVYNDYTTYIKTSEIDMNIDVDSAVDYAYIIGKGDNLFLNNYDVFNTILNGTNIMPKVTFDESSLKNILNNLSPELPDAVIESGYYIEKNNLIITKGNDGYTIDVESTFSNIKSKLSNLNYLNEVVQIETVVATPKAIDLEKIYNEIRKDPKDAYFTAEPHVVYPSENGIDFKVSFEEAEEILQTSDTECTIPLKVLYPEITTNMIGQEAFPDLLATFSTRYSASNYNRTTNLRLAANKIDGYVLLPGETFSYNSVVGERTISAGYKEAAVYENGEVVQGLGGGICQISTTLYNAVLFSNLEIVELHNHQFVPSYVTAGRDATVVYGVKDFQFKNSRQYALKITCSVSNGVATFQIWGLLEDTEYDVDVYANVTSRTSSYIKSSTYRTLSLNGEIINSENVLNATYKVHQ